jgi:hypothetical protein
MALSPTSSRSSSSGSPSSQTLLSTTTLGGAGQLNVTGIDQTYNDLILVVIARCSTAATVDLIDLRLNGDSGVNQYVFSDTPMSTGAVSASRLQTSLIRLNQNFPAASAVAGQFGMLMITIPGYASTTWLKQVLVSGIGASAGTIATLVGDQTVALWNSTAAVNQVTIFGDSAANLVTGSTLRIYGRL